MPTKLFVGNVSESCTEDDLKQAFEKYGPIVEHAIKRNYAFVHFEKKEDAETAIKELHESELKGNVIRVLHSTTPHKTGRTGGGGGRGPPYSRDRDRPGYSRGPPPRRGYYERGYGPEGGSRYHPYDDYYRGSYPQYSSRGSGGQGYGYYGSYDNDYYSRDNYPARSYPPQSSNSYGDRYSGRPVTYPDVKRQPSSQWDRWCTHATWSFLVHLEEQTWLEGMTYVLLFGLWGLWVVHTRAITLTGVRTVECLWNILT